jgi:exodeoxyribonuclease-3
MSGKKTAQLRFRIFKIATFNINNINSRLDNLLEWLDESKPDIVCLQELKADHSDFPESALSKAGYQAVWRGQKSWNGVAILSRVGEPVVTRYTLPGDPVDTQSRYIEAAVAGLIIGCIYLPNGNPQPGPKFDYKLQWFKRLTTHARKLWNSRHPVILAGDYNVVATEQDIYPTKSWDNDALLQPESRRAYRKLLSQGWDDAIRTLFPDERIYTFWDYKRKRWERDAGLRLDHFLLSKKLAKRLIDGGVDREVRGRAHASDHAPTWIKVKVPSLT